MAMCVSIHDHQHNYKKFRKQEEEEDRKAKKRPNHFISLFFGVRVCLCLQSSSHLIPSRIASYDLFPSFILLLPSVSTCPLLSRKLFVWGSDRSRSDTCRFSAVVTHE
ncbi:hypothetical protein P3342_011228 [Pyrenophora teres f. teres]|nr:hypothetical protein P3342_011228 [Pyrenophora teres f. teres]